MRRGSSHYWKCSTKEGTVSERRVRDRPHHTLRSAAQWERVLGYRIGRLATETPDQRTSRLHWANEPCATNETDPGHSESEKGLSRANELHTTDETDPRGSGWERGPSPANEPCATVKTDSWDSRSERPVLSKWALRNRGDWSMRLLKKQDVSKTERVTGDKKSNSLFVQKFSFSSSSWSPNVLHA